jgi:tetratricopeptide (TPR) repeat protein
VTELVSGMNRAARRQFKNATKLGSVGKINDALQTLQNSIDQTSNCVDKAGLLYYKVLWLLDIEAVPQAREAFVEMQREVAKIGPPPQDADQMDLGASLSVMVRFAEAKVLMKERNDAAALDVLEDLTSQYPKQLSLHKLRDLRGEIEMHRGILLANADRWLEAGVFLERAVPPPALKPLFCYYMGQYCYTVRDYQRAAKNLKQSFTSNMPPHWRCRAHYMSGFAEYHLFHLKEAKKQFELSIRTEDPEFMRKYDIWGLLERISRVLKLDAEAEKYRKLREEAENASTN